MVDVAGARAEARKLLADVLPRRWRHVQGVAARAEEVAACVPDADGVLVAAAWLHDVGYAPVLLDTGFHPLDGARYLRKVGVDDRVVELVAHHSCAYLEAELRGLAGELASEFPHEVSPVADALCLCDMTTGPGGEPVRVEDRISEIKERYGPGELVTRFITRAEPDIVATVRRAEQVISDSQPR